MQQTSRGKLVKISYILFIFSAIFLRENRVVHGSHFQAIFGSFSLFIFLSFFKNELQNESRMTQNMIILQNGVHPPILQRWPFLLSFSSHFHVPFFFVISNSAPTPNLLQWLMTTINNNTPSLTPLPPPPPPQLHHHQLSPFPCPLPCQLTSYATNHPKPRSGPTDTNVIWALGNVFLSSCFLLFFN